MKNSLKYLFAMTMAAAGISAYAASGVIELKIPGMNAETAARIADFRPFAQFAHYSSSPRTGRTDLPKQRS